MKSKCSFILKASLALVLALVMLFGTVATSVAAVVEDDLADTGADVDVADEGAAVDVAETGNYNTGSSVNIYYDNSITQWSQVYFRIGRTSYNAQTQMTLVSGTTYLYYISLSNWNDYEAFNFANNYGWTNNNTIYENHNYTAATVYKKFELSNGSYYFKGTDATVGSAGKAHYGACVGATGNGTDGDTTRGNYTTYSKTVTRSAVTNGNVKVDYVNTSRNAASIANGNTSSNATALIGSDITVTVTPSSGYYTKSISATNSSTTSANRSNTLTTTLTGNSTTTVTADILLPKYYLGGLGNGWNQIEMTSQGDGWYKVTKSLTKNKTYSAETTNYWGYKIYDEQNDKYWRYGTAVTSTKTKSSPVTLVSTDGDNSSLTTANYSYGSTTYTFYYKPSTNQLAIYYPVAVTYSKNGVTTTAFPSTPYYYTYDTKIGSAPATTPAATGYTFDGWYTGASNNTTFDFANTSITDATTIYAHWTEVTGGIALQSVTNGNVGDTSGGHIENGSGTTITSLSGIGIGTKGTAVSVTSGAGYSFLGWTIEGDQKSHVKLYTNSNCTTEYTAGGTNATIYVKTDGTSGLTTDNVIIKAHFQSSDAKYITVYNNTLYDRQHWVVVSSPPQTVKVTNPAGTVKTYKYGAGTKAQRGENQTSTGHPELQNIADDDGDTYYEGNLLEVHQGDKVELVYSALASSDIITGVFYNNGIRYPTEKENDNLFLRRVYNSAGYGDKEHGYTNGASESNPPDDDVDFDYHDDTTHASASETGGYALYANQYYYNTELATVIAAQNYTATVDQDTHTVTWTVGNQNYYNIDMELNSKKEIHFSDTVNAAIHEVHTDNYYAVGEDVSPSTTETGSLSIKAAGNSTQTNTITKANIKFYYCNNMGEYINPVNGKVVSKANRVELKEGDATLTVEGSAASISNSGTTPSTSFYYIDGPMPATDVMVDLDITATYSLVMKSKIQYDGVNSKTAFLQVADLTLGTTKKTKSDSHTTSTTVTSSPATCTSGNSITFKAENITSGYMFVGWFLDKDGSPDLASEPLSRNATFSYKPTASVTVWAVGTRNLYINGSRYLFSGTRTDWQNDNVEMKYDSVKQLYYHEIDSTIFTAASSNFLTRENTNNWVGGNDNADTGGNNYGYKESGGKYYWMSRADSEHGNAYFQIINSPTGHSDNSQKTVWGGVYSFRTQANGITVGKAQRRGEDDNDENNRRNGQGFIDFSTSRYAGYDVPLRIYFNPSTSALTAEATPIYPHIYVSDGYKGIDQATPSTVSIKVNNGTARLNSCKNDSNYSYNMKFIGNGWDPTYEGHVSDISVSARNATLTLSKTVTNTDYKVSNFLVYNMTKGTVKAHPATASGTTYTCNTIKTSDDDRLYIVPIIEYCGDDAKITINVDSTKLDYKKWGKLVSCYAWGPSDAPCGSYPGQLMVPSDDGGSWTATFKAPSTLTGILFGNYVDASGSDGYTFISEPGIMGNVTYSGSGDSSNDPRIVTIAHSDYVTQYNKISSGDHDKYTMANCKVQTYDYREPIAYLNNKPAGASNTTLTFALKDGNSNLLSRSHAQLKDVNILTLASTSNPSTPYTWSALKWEYLTDSSGDYYTDLNGFKLPEKPTASFYIAAKGMVKYSDNAMNTVFKTGKEYDSVTGVNYNDYYGRVANEIDMNYAVQWYVYDAAGNYITDVLSAGFADKTDEGTDNTNYSTAMTVVTQRLLDLGYAVEGRSVKICYDKPRYCYWDNKDVAPNINNGDSFNVYRFTGQWYEDNEYRTAKVYAKVGIKTDNGVDVAEASAAAYGSASVEVDGSKCSIAGYSGTNTEGDVDYGYTTIIDGDSGALTLTASPQNFVGWYHYVTTYDSSDIESSDTTQELVFDTADPEYKPNYSKDVTYIAIYKAKVNYRYKYVGREGGTKYYNVPGSTDDNVDNMSAAEIANGNKVATDSTHMTNATDNVPGSAGISIFKKDIIFNGTLTTSMFSNELEYVLTVNNSSKSDPTYTVTAMYRDSTGAIKDKAVSKQYNQVIDLTVENSGTALTNQWAGHNFIGWYEYNTSTSTYGNLLSTQANYGLVCIKTQTIIAVYSGDGSGKTGPVGNNTWEVFVDDHGPTYEKTSSTTGDVYCDAIVRVRMNNSNLTTLDEGGRVGMLIVDDNGSNQTISTSKLANYAIALRASNGKSGNVKVGDYTLSVTNLFSTSVNRFGRVDLAAKYSYGNVTGQKYHIYAYYFKGGDATDASNYIFSTMTGYATGTYS